MKTTQSQIKGYRQLTKKQIDMINACKEVGDLLEQLCNTVKNEIQTQITAASLDPVELNRIAAAEPERWIAMATTDMQVAIMKLVRAVAQPTTF